MQCSRPSLEHRSSLPFCMVTGRSDQAPSQVLQMGALNRNLSCATVSFEQAPWMITSFLQHTPTSSRLSICAMKHSLPHNCVAVRASSRSPSQPSRSVLNAVTLLAPCARQKTRHRYLKSIASDDREQTPSEFMRSLRTRLPSRVQLQNFPDLPDRVSESPKDKDRNDEHVKTIANAKIGSRQFTLGHFHRCDRSWRIIYESDDVRLELLLRREAQWFLFVNSPPDLPSNSELRKSLKTPVAHGAVKESLLDVD